jgi:hypothetical protein
MVFGIARHIFAAMSKTNSLDERSHENRLFGILEAGWSLR